jgi:hypothetical protein
MTADLKRLIIGFRQKFGFDPACPERRRDRSRLIRHGRQKDLARACLLGPEGRCVFQGRFMTKMLQAVEKRLKPGYGACVGAVFIYFNLEIRLPVQGILEKMGDK